jgi:hypothetical protein
MSFPRTCWCRNFKAESLDDRVHFQHLLSVRSRRFPSLDVQAIFEANAGVAAQQCRKTWGVRSHTLSGRGLVGRLVGARRGTG